KQPTLSIWIGGAPEEVNYLESLIKEFEESSGLKVNVVRQPTDSDQRRQGLVVTLRAHQPDPDVFLMDVAWVGQFMQSGWLEPLDGYFPKESDSLKVFFQRVLHLADFYEGKLCALPMYIDGGLLYYRKDLLDEIGHPDPPRTWSELVDLSQRIQDQERKSNPNFYGFVWQGAQYEGLVCNFLEFAASNQGGVIDSQKILVDLPANIAPLQLMYNLIHQYQVSPPNTFTEMKEEEVRRWFQRGNALFERNWPYAWKLHQQDDSPIKGKVGVAPLPCFEGGTSASTLGGWHIGMSRSSDVKDQAWQLIRFMESYETQKKLALHLGWNPGRRDVYSDPEVLAELPHLSQLKQVFELAVARPNVPYYTQISAEIQRYVNECLADRINATQALQEMQRQIDKIQETYHAQ
ncbi:MAG: ABC transporter substrate-binding protein, partial [Candidatus Zixiibacteriota bacterium]